MSSWFARDTTLLAVMDILLHPSVVNILKVSYTETAYLPKNYTFKYNIVKLIPASV